MYAIAQVIYGVPLTRDHLAELSDKMDEESIEDVNEGYLRYYSGNSNQPPAAFGVELCEFDEATDYVAIADLRLEPTSAQRAKYQRLLQELDSQYRTVIEKETPSVFILWSTS